MKIKFLKTIFLDQTKIDFIVKQILQLIICVSLFCFHKFLLLAIFFFLKIPFTEFISYDQNSNYNGLFQSLFSLKSQLSFNHPFLIIITFIIQILLVSFHTSVNFLLYHVTCNGLSS